MLIIVKFLVISLLNIYDAYRMFFMIKIHLSRLLGEHKKRIADLQRDTGLARNTLAGLYRDDVTRIDKNTLDLLCKYFACPVGDLVEWLPDEAPAASAPQAAVKPKAAPAATRARRK